MPKKKPNVYIMTDEEYDKMLQEEEAKSMKADKNSFMDRLTEVTSKRATRFSSRTRKKETPKTKPKEETFSFDEKIPMPELMIPEKTLSQVAQLDEASWDDMLEEFDELSPIDDITEEERRRYRRKGSGDKYDEMFKKEQSMLSEVLKDLQERSKIVNNKVKDISSRTKSAYGVSKSFADLLNAGNAVDASKLQVIKSMVDIKKTIQDMRLKDLKNSPDAEESNDTIADRFYKSIMNGSGHSFITSSMSQYHAPMNSTYEDMDGNEVPEFNVTQPISSQLTNPDNIDIDKVDPYGYIRNESKNVSISVYRYPDNSLEFVALSEQGELIDDYQLPDESLLESLNIRPGSPFGYDKYGRRYKIIDVDEVPDDEDEESYDDITNDDKYSYDESDDE